MKAGHGLEYALKIDIDLGKDNFDKEQGQNHDRNHNNPSDLDEFSCAESEVKNEKECADDEAEMSAEQKKYAAECEQI